MSAVGYGRADEGRHESGTAAWWEECWDFDFAAPDAALGGFVRMALYPNQRRAWCWVYVLRADGTVAVRDHDVPMPGPASLLARAEALWCEPICETPMEHWSIVVEAFGVRLDDPFDGLRGEIGARLPVGLDLEWEASAKAVASTAMPGYAQACAVRGDVLLGDEVIPFDGGGTRRHTWGERDWWSGPFERVWCAAGEPTEVAEMFDSVVPLPERDGRTAHVTRTLSMCTLADDARAPGWLERVVVDE